MRLFITGDIGEVHADTVNAALDEISSHGRNMTFKYVTPKGIATRIGKRIDNWMKKSKPNNASIIEYCPEYHLYGNAAMMIAERQAIDSGVDLVLAFSRGGSIRKWVVKLAAKRGIPVFVIRPDGSGTLDIAPVVV
jgi:hypothetical protein